MAVIGPDFVFVHVPRTAGESISAALGGECHDIPRHMPWSILRGRHGDKWSFGVVRDPFTQLPSVYARHVAPIRRKKFEARRRAEIDRAYGFRGWLLSRDREYRQPGAPLPHQRLPQTWWLEGVDFVCRYERLTEDLRVVAERIGRRIILPRRNGWSHTLRQPVHDADTIAFIARWHADVIERYGYAIPRV